MGGCNPFIAAEGPPSRKTNLFYELLSCRKMEIHITIKHCFYEYLVHTLLKLYINLKWSIFMPNKM